MRVLWVQIVPPPPPLHGDAPWTPPRGGGGGAASAHDATPSSYEFGRRMQQAGGGGGGGGGGDQPRRASYFEGFAALTSSPRLIQTPPNLTPEQSPARLVPGQPESALDYAPPTFMLPPDVISVSPPSSSPPSSSAATARHAPSMLPAASDKDSPAKSLRRL